MSLNKRQPRKNPLKPQRNFKDFLKFTAAAILLIILIDYAIFKGERPYITKMKDEYYAEQALKEKALKEALPPKIIFPDDGGEYFEAPELKLKDQQSLLPKKELNVTKLLPEEKIAPPKKIKKYTPKKFKGKKAKIAIVIDDVGMNLKQSRAAINLPSEVTLAMLPYAKTVRDLANTAKEEGHELIIHTPMEAISKDISLGSMALYEGMNKSAFNAEFNKIADSFEGYVGVNNHMGSRLTQNSTAMNMLMDQLKKRGLFFLDSKTIHNSVAASTARDNDIPHAVRDVFLDHEETPEFLIKALKNTERIARNHGSAIAIGHPKQVTMSALRKWIPTLERRGYELVPLSALITTPQKPKIQEAKIEEPRTKKVQNIEPAAGDEIEIETEELPTLNFSAPAPANNPIQMRKEGLPSISYPVN